jgi:hypothetical protein
VPGVSINKEASMQLQCAYILKQMLPLTLQQKGESADLELETAVKTESGTNNIDILLRVSTLRRKMAFAIEMKCCSTIAASGGNRGAHDIFMKDVYEDLHVLEGSVARGHASQGIAVVMNDLERFVNPKVKNGKCWAYDISQGHTFAGGQIAIPIGGKAVHVDLKKHYAFNWPKSGDIWLMELEGATN